MVSKANLDKRICDVVKGASNKQTYREFIVDSETEFGMAHGSIDALTDEELRDYVDTLDYFHEK